MFSLDQLHFADFNNLYVISVGLSMAYIVVEANKTKEGSFFSILSSITAFVKAKVLSIIPKKVKEEEEWVTTQIQYYINSKLLKERTIGSLTNTKLRAEKVLKKIHDYEDYVERKLKFHTKTDFLNVISCDCFLYGLFILFVGAFENKCGLNLNGLIVTVLITIMILLIHCLWFERLKLESKTRYYKPRILLHIFLLIVAILLGYKINTLGWCTTSNETRGLLSVFSVITCYSGFMAYLFTVVAANIVLSIIILVKSLFFRKSLSQAVEDHKKEIESHREELDDVDKRLSETNLAGELSITTKK